MKFKYVLLASGLLLAGSQMNAVNIAEEIKKYTAEFNAALAGVSKVITEDLNPTINDIKTNVQQFKDGIININKSKDAAVQITDVAKLIDDLQVTLTRLGKIVVDIGTDVVTVFDAKAADTTNKVGTVIEQLSEQIASITDTMRSIASVVEAIEQANKSN